ncbi:MAG: UvrD-helicase domain-containing protein [Lewinellaceae bacterium]|nr:UvrD-helicase domain-containing protein [Lewinellaceae bacterium]
METNTPGNYLNSLNDVQRQAVTTIDGPVLVVAGPGSGKTRVLTYRIAHIIQQGTAPWAIMALTFTNKAAREMKERIGKVVGPQADKVWAGTFHSIFARILRVEAEKIGYPSNFTIYDTDDTKSLIGTILQEMHLDRNVYNPNTVRSRISSAKSNLITPRLYAQNEELRNQDRMAKMPQIYDIYEKYVVRCKRAGAMDFDDLLYRLYELLQTNPDNILEKYRSRFTHFLVDEFQDTNHLQYSIIRKLVNFDNSPRNICVVGDDAQSIYAFRGATIQNILDFEADFKPFNIRVFKLEQNYRSTDHIVQAANVLIQNNSRQIPKKIWSDKGEGHKIKVLEAITDNEEGKRVIDTIVEQKNRFHLSNSDIVVLYRTNSQSRIFEEYLRRFNLAYKVYGGQSFYQRKEVKDLIAYLRLVVNMKDEEALRRVINYPKRGIGQTTVEKIGELAAATNRTMWECLLEVQAGARTANALTGFKEMIVKANAQLDTSDAYELAVHMAKQSGLLDDLKADTSIEGLSRKENVDGLLDAIKSFVDEDTVIDTQTLPDKSLATYLQNIALLTDADENADQRDFITLMSIHSAKGLEFKSVFVTGLEEKLFPSYLSMENAEGMDEERRLFYVAVTRAEQFLTLSYAKNRYRFGQMRINDPSRFLGEIPRQHLESTAYIRTGGEEAAVSTMSRVMGNFQKRTSASSPVLRADPKDFKPSASENIQAGMKVLHLKFGEGKVISIDGGKDNRIATIHFQDIDAPERRIMLKFAKLQILE